MFADPSPSSFLPPKYVPQSLAGKRAFISGGTTGIGRAVAYLLVASGARVFVYGHRADHLADALSDMADASRIAGGAACGAVADQGQTAEIVRVFGEADAYLGGLDILVCNAGIGGGSVVEAAHEEIERVIAVNLTGYLLLCKEAALRMRPPQMGGHIVLLGSLAAQVNGAGSDLYVASKYALRGFAEAFRKKVNADNIKVSLLEPGLVGTDMTGGTREEQEGRQARGESLTTEDIAHTVYFTLTQPARCDVILTQVRPHHQAI